MKETFVLDHAPKGDGAKCTVGIFLQDGTEMQIDLIDGEYVLDEEKDTRRKFMVASLVKAGFRSAGVVVEPEKKKAPDRYPETIVLEHPDNTPGNLIDTEVTVNRKKIKVEAGIVKTDDPKVVAALAKKGYLVQNPHALERSQEEDTE